MSINHGLAVIGFVALAPLNMSCVTLECGEGTLEKDGVCIAADGQSPSNDVCAAGTVGTANGCVPIYDPTICGANAVGVLNEVTGVIECIGTGGGGGCGSSFLCQGADAGKTTVCGQFIEAGTNQPLAADDATGSLCDLDNPTETGPCSLEILFYDALEFAQDPTGAAPLPAFPTEIDDCGRWRGVNITVPALGFLGVGVGDSSNRSSADNYALTGVALPVASAQTVSKVSTFAVSLASDAAWTSSAGAPFGTTSFAERGVYMPIFLHGEDPVSGVKVTANSSTQPSSDFYFSDTDDQRTTIDSALEATGANGSALLVDSDLVPHGGAGGEPTDCVWPEDLADAIPGVVFAQPRHAETSGGEECP